MEFNKGESGKFTPKSDDDIDFNGLRELSLDLGYNLMGDNWIILLMNMIRNKSGYV